MILTKVAKILSPMQVVLPVGAEHGVREGMDFVIYELGEEIFDPETQAPLGRLELHKGRVKVSQVQDKLSVATTLSRVVERMVPTFDFLATKYKEVVYDQLPLDASIATAEAEPSLTVKVGDMVRSIS